MWTKKKIKREKEKGERKNKIREKVNFNQNIKEMKEKRK